MIVPGGPASCSRGVWEAYSIDLYPLGVKLGTKMEKIQENMVLMYFWYENIRKCFLICNFICFEHFYPPLHASYRIKVHSIYLEEDWPLLW